MCWGTRRPGLTWNSKYNGSSNTPLFTYRGELDVTENTLATGGRLR